jgi:hypothetical protein
MPNAGFQAAHRAATRDCMTATGSRLLWWAGIAALAGIGTFGVLAWHSVTVEHAQPDDALRRFGEIRSGLGWSEPMLRVDAAGVVTRRQAPEISQAVPPTRLRVLAYRAPERRLVQAEVPFWFLKLKGPAVQYVLRGTGLDWNHLGVSPSDLERHGVCLILDETRTNGDRLLVWTD